MKIITALALITVLTGCESNAGPFVTNISPDGRGGINVDKCMVKYNRMIAVVEASDCKQNNIVLPK